LVQLDIVKGERRVALHGLLLCEGGHLASSGPAALWHYTQGDRLFFSDSRSGMAGSVSWSRCNKYVAERNQADAMRHKAVILASIEKEMRHEPIVEAPCSVVVSTMSTLEQISAVCSLTETAGKVHVEFFNVDPVKCRIVDIIVAAVRGKKHLKTIKSSICYHLKPPYEYSGTMLDDNNSK